MVDEKTYLINNKGPESKTNWMKTAQLNSSLFIQPTSISEIQAIVKDESKYPSPVRPAGLILSPSALCKNEGGTTLSTAKMNQIHGIRQVAVPGSANTSSIACIDCEPGVTLRDLQQYAHKHDHELPFSAEIGSSTIGGTCFAVTKDSAVGKPPLDGMGIGDVSSMLWSVQMVEEGGNIKEYCMLNEKGEYDEYFQRLLDSYGGTGIAVRMMITARSKTAITTVVDVSRIDWRNGEEDMTKWAEKVRKEFFQASSLNGNVFGAISLRSNLVLLEKRLIGDDRPCAPFSFIIGPLYTALKKYLSQRCDVFPSYFNMLRLFSGSVFLRYSQESRSPGNHYDLAVPKSEPRVSFSFYSFPIEGFVQVFVEALKFVSNYEQKYGYAPVAFAIYFVRLNGKRVAGPYAMKDTEYCFSFDPLTNNPNDPEWDAFVSSFNSFAKSKGGKCGLNQTLCLDRDEEYGATTLGIDPSPRFASSWLNQFASSP